MSELFTSPRHTILIDGYGFVFRAYHAVPPLTRPDGVAVGAVYGFTSMLMKLIGEIKATHIAVIFDSGKKTFRNDLYPKYKAHRPPVPEDLIPQFSIVREAAQALNLTIIEQEGYEADDIIATLARKALSIDETVTIVSSDKDLMQLVNHQIRMYDPVKSKIIGEKEVIEKFGVGPDKVVDVLSMIGDASDNIPGIPGIGPKGAAELINQFNSLEEVIKRSSEIKQNRKREIVENNIELALLSKKLVSLHDQVPLDFTLDCLKMKDVDLSILINFLKAQGFKSLVTRAQNQFTSIKEYIEPIELIQDTKDYEYITDISRFSKCINEIEKAAYISIFPQIDADKTILGISLSSETDTFFVKINNDKIIQQTLL
ncbi:MAG: 5'-3' exonuclease H3TH domain-containing protein, partial [Alphaproteobacteria bacterium]